MATVVLPSKGEVDAIFAKLGDAVNAYTPDSGIEATQARAQVRELAKRLFLATMTAGDLGVQHCKDMGVLIAVRTSMRLGLLKNLPESGLITSKDLGKAAGVDPNLIERIFRLLVAVGFVDQEGEDGTGGYKHSHFSRDYLEPTKPSAGAMVQGLYDQYFKNTVKLDDYLATQFKAPIPEPTSIFNNCYNWSRGREGQSIWDTMAEVPEDMAIFVNVFAGMDVIVPTSGSYFDYNQLASSNSDAPDRVEIVDVGGGDGRVLQDMLKASPKLDPKKCVLQDIEKVLSHECGISKEGVKLQVIDFYKEQPIKGAKAYFLRYIMHDHADDAAKGILEIIAGAMAPDSRIFLAEIVVPERITEANVDAAVFDQILLCIGGKERTARNFKQLLESAGLEMTDIHYVKGTVGGLVEARLRK